MYSPWAFTTGIVTAEVPYSVLSAVLVSLFQDLYRVDVAANCQSSVLHRSIPPDRNEPLAPNSWLPVRGHSSHRDILRHPRTSNPVRDTKLLRGFSFEPIRLGPLYRHERGDDPQALDDHILEVVDVPTEPVHPHHHTHGHDRAA
jgi:hypothetical protein